jgi:anti-sigma regulatory factor (Ser/Thr protein kinase)
MVLQQANELLYPDIPANMFVTCLYAILDVQTGRLVYANAGHDLPYHKHDSGVAELRARGMPLGLMPGMSYEEKETYLAPGDSVLFYSDGLVEAHDARRQMFSFGRLQRLIAEHEQVDVPLVGYLLHELEEFTGAGWDQEDDITLVTLQRLEASMATGLARQEGDNSLSDDDRLLLTEFRVPSEPGNERIAMWQVAEAVRDLDLPQKRVDQLKTAVAEATMNAMEHGNKFQSEVPVLVRVFASRASLSVGITDQGGAPPDVHAQTPDLEAKLANLQTVRGWGLFLIENMVDELHVTSDEHTHTVELVLKLGAGDNGS